MRRKIENLKFKIENLGNGAIARDFSQLLIFQASTFYFAAGKEKKLDKSA
ncbi:MAG: hypothetical protein Kow0037_31470 [Calditrichia bacterium]